MRIRRKIPESEDQTRPGAVTVTRTLTRKEVVRNRAIWQGHPRFRAMTILYGRVELSARIVKAKPWERNIARLNMPGCTVLVRWYRNTVPPGLKDGDIAIVVGRLVSHNMGADIMAIEAMLIRPGTNRHFRKSFLTTLENYILAPREFMDLPDDYVEGAVDRQTVEV